MRARRRSRCPRRGSRVPGALPLGDRPARPRRARLRHARSPTSCGALPRRASTTRPTSSRSPRSEDGRRGGARVGGRREDVAVIPYGGGTSVVGGVEPRVGDDYAGAVSLDLARLDRVLEVDRGLARGAHPGRRRAARRSRTSCAARADAAPLPAVVRVLDARRLDRHARRRALRHAATRTSTTSSSRSARSRRRASGRAGGCPARGAGPSPDRMLLGSEGILGVITEAWMRVQPRPAPPRVARACASPTSSTAREAVRAHRRRRACTRPTAGCSTPRRRAATGRRRRPPARVLVLGFESADHAVDASLDARRWRSAARTAARPDEAARRPATPPAPGARRSSRCPTCATRCCSSACSPRRSRPRSPGTASRRSTRRVDRRRSREALGEPVPRDLPLHPRLPRRPRAVLHRARAGAPRRGGRSSGSEIKRAASDAILAAGGTITHHHAVGRDHRPWYDRQRPDAVRRRAARRQGARSTRPACSTPAC